MIQSKTMHEPLMKVREGDYGYQSIRVAEPDDYPPEFMKDQEACEILDLHPILSDDFRFSPDAEPGLEAVDILANAIRRALNGNLREFGWNEIPGLMIHRSNQYIRFITLAPEGKGPTSAPNGHVVDAFRSGGRSIFLPSEND